MTIKWPIEILDNLVNKDTMGIFIICENYNKNNV